MSFYPDLRDNTAAPLIEQYGRSATLRQITASYNPATGQNTQSPLDVLVKVVLLPVRPGGPFTAFSAEQMEKFEQMMILSAKEVAEAGIPAVQVNDQILIGSDVYVIMGVSAVAPSGVAVIYKLGCAHG